MSIQSSEGFCLVAERDDQLLVKIQMQTIDHPPVAIYFNLNYKPPQPVK